MPAVPGGFTHAIATDNRGGLWLSLWLTSNDYGLAHLVDGKIVEQATWQKLGGGPGTGLVPDPDGGVWTGLLSGGVAHFRSGQIRNLSLTDDGDKHASRKVLDVSRDRDGAMWVATDDGLSRIANGRVATLTDGERIALQNGSLDHRRPIGCLLAVHGVRPRAYTATRIGCVDGGPEANRPVDDIR